jgi:hypothetical protein
VKKNVKAGTVACITNMKNAYISVGKPEGKRQLKRPRCRWNKERGTRAWIKFN